VHICTLFARVSRQLCGQHAGRPLQQQMSQQHAQGTGAPSRKVIPASNSSRSRIGQACLLHQRCTVLSALALASNSNLQSMHAAVIRKCCRTSPCVRFLSMPVGLVLLWSGSGI
jgi:hypothetical protein